MRPGRGQSIRYGARRGQPSYAVTNPLSPCLPGTGYRFPPKKKIPQSDRRIGTAREASTTSRVNITPAVIPPPLSLNPFWVMFPPAGRKALASGRYGSGFGSGPVLRPRFFRRPATLDLSSIGRALARRALGGFDVALQVMLIGDLVDAIVLLARRRLLRLPGCFIRSRRIADSCGTHRALFRGRLMRPYLGR